MIERGGRRDIFLGTRECQGYVTPCEFLSGDSFYDDYGDIAFGFMFHGVDYPDETRKNELGVRYWNCEMKNGVIRFPVPNDSIIKRRKVRDNVEMKEFDLKDRNILSVTEEEGVEE
jgi:CRISPR-associated protein Cas5d